MSESMLETFPDVSGGAPTLHSVQLEFRADVIIEGPLRWLLARHFAGGAGSNPGGSINKYFRM